MSFKSKGGINTDAMWDDLRVAVFDTAVNGSNPPIDAIYKNNGAGSGETAGALSLINTGSIGTIADNNTYDFENKFTIEFWYFPTVTTVNWRKIIEKVGIFDISYTANGRLSINTFNYSRPSTQITIGAWNHIVLSVDSTIGNGNDFTKLYINGVLAVSLIGWSALTNNTNPILINSGNNNFNIDNLILHNIALTDVQVLNTYNEGLGVDYNGTETNIAGLWKFDETSGNIFTDSTSTSNDGLLSGVISTNFNWVGGHVGLLNQSSKGVILKFFNPTVQNELYFTVQMPHAWKYGTDLSPHLHWVGLSDGGVNEKVRWGLEYTWQNLGTVYGNTTIIYGDTNHLDEDIVKDKHYLTAFPDISGEGNGISSMLVCRIFRDASNDNYNDFVGLLEFDIHYQIDSLGSRFLYRK